MTALSCSRTIVEQASNGAIEVELFIGTQLCSNGAECLQGVADGSVDIFISTSGGACGHLPLRAGARPALPDGATIALPRP
jgi:TRAP-type C4-dicarboxylate transport system substrate-binding protein